MTKPIASPTQAEKCPECGGNGNLNGVGNEDGGDQWACEACDGTGERKDAENA